MMVGTSFLSPLVALWQVAVLASAGWLLFRFSIGRRPLLASSACRVTFVVVAAATLLLCLPSPQLPNFSPALSPPNSAHHQPRSAPDPRIASGDVNAPADPMWSISINELLHTIQSAAQSTANQIIIRQLPLLHPIVSLCIAIGFLKFAVELLMLWRLHSKLTDIEHESTLRIVATLREEHFCCRQIRICHSSQVTSAAVIGWRHPTLVLPSGYSTWSDAELRCVIAHELSHVQHNDFAWRICGRLLVALHHYNPLVHWLFRSLIMSQERVADATAARAIGEKSYIKTISRLALQQDNGFGGRNVSGLSPVFSGELIRRIKMLKRYHAGSEHHLSRWLQAGVWFGLGTLLAGCVGIRACAQSPQEIDQPPVARLAKQITAPSPDAASANPTTGMFKRPVLTPDLVPENTLGMFHIDTQAIWKHRELPQVLPLINSKLASGLKEALGSESLPIIRMEEIESIYGTCAVAAACVPDQEPNGYLTIGSGSVAVKFNRPIHLEEWVTGFIPGAIAHHAEKLTCYKLPIIPVLGPSAMHIATRHEGDTLYLSNVFLQSLEDASEVARLSDHSALTEAPRQPNTSVWADVYRRSAGGLLTIAFTKERLELDNFDKNRPEEQAIAKVLEQCHAFGFGVDCSDDGRLGIRLRLATSNADQARAVLEHVREWKQAATEMNQKNQQSTKLVDSLVMSIEDFADGKSDVLVQFKPDTTVAALLGEALAP